jgi:hypothetical protein
MIADLTILEITATNMVVGDIKVDEDIESSKYKKKSLN